MRPELAADVDKAIKAIAERLDMQPCEMKTLCITAIVEALAESIAQIYRPVDVDGLWSAADDALTPVVAHPERGR